MFCWQVAIDILCQYKQAVVASGNDLPHCCWTRAAHSYCTQLACLTRPYHKLACLTRPYHSTVESFGHDLTPLAVWANSAVLFDILQTIYEIRTNDIWHDTYIWRYTITHVSLYLKTDHTCSPLRDERYKHFLSEQTISSVWCCTTFCFVISWLHHG